MIYKRDLKVLLLLCFLFPTFPVYGLGLKIIKQFPDGVMAEAMPWQIDTEKDWVFIATDDGLLQYDGIFPDLFPINNHRAVRSVFMDKEWDRIFVGGINEFGFFKPSSVSSLEYICLSESVGEDRNIGNIWGIYYKDGVVFAQGDSSILKYDINSGKHEVIYSDYKLDTSHLINGVLWLGTDNGLKVLLGSNIVDAPSSEILRKKRIREILPYKKGYIIVASDGLWYYEGMQLQSFPLTDKVISQMGEIFSADIKGDLLAIGSVANGVGIFDLATGDQKIYDELRGLPSNTVISLKFDDAGNLWTGLQYGMAKVMLNQPIERIDNSLIPIGSGYVLAEYGNKLYMGTNRGVYVVPFEDYKKRLGPGYSYIDGLQGQVWGLSNINGDLLCSHDRGLFLLRDDGHIKRIGDISGVWDVQKIIGSHDKAYAGTYSGLYILQKQKDGWKVISQIDGFPNSMYNFVQESPNIVWSDNDAQGIVRLTIDTIDNKVKDLRYFTSAEDGTPLTSEVHINRLDNDVYFSTNNGIYIYDKKSGQIRKEKGVSDLLGNPNVVKRLKKANGSILALTDKEVIETDPAGILDMTRIRLESSLARPMHEKDVFFPIGSDYIGFPTRNGYLFFDYSDREDHFWKDSSPTARINYVVVSNNKDSVIYRGNFKNIKSEPVLGYKDNSLRIIYGNEEDLKNGILYSTHLNNEPWSVPSPTFAKELDKLKEGKYQFEVKAISPDGKEAVDSFTFRISPPWWRSKWILALYGIILIAGIFVVIRYGQEIIYKKQRKVLEEKERELELQKFLHKQESEEKDRHIQKLERDQFEKELRHKAQEVANVMMNLSHKNETLQSVKRDLQNVLHLIPRGNIEARKALNEIQDKVVVDINSDNVLKRVEEEFDIIHDNFMKKLREKYPDLNNNEILLCAYLKMNLSTKEIAPLLNISQRGVETLRYRLRKKLNLDRMESLSNFILNFS